jgi:hypothetical protein
LLTGDAGSEDLEGVVQFVPKRFGKITHGVEARGASGKNPAQDLPGVKCRSISFA